MNEYIVELEGVSKGFPGVKALDKVSFNLKSGEVVALLGENGAGKSTLMKILSGVYTKDEGSMKILGQVVEDLNPVKDGTKSTLIKSEHFAVEKYVINGKCKLKNNQFFTLVNVVGGRGDLQVEDEVYTLSQGDFFMLSALAEDYSFKGQLDIIESHVEFP